MYSVSISKVTICDILMIMVVGKAGSGVSSVEIPKSTKYVAGDRSSLDRINSTIILVHDIQVVPLKGL